MTDDIQPKEDIKNKGGEIEKPPDDTIVPPEIVEKTPEKAQREFKSFVQMGMRIFSGSLHPLTEKITPEHITEIIKNIDEQDSRDRTERNAERKQSLTIFLIVIITIIFFVSFLVLMREKEILNYLIAAVLGFGGGYGVGKYHQS